MTPDDIRAQIAALLEVPQADLSIEDNLLDHGLDSIRVMSLLETWRAAGFDLTFADLAETPTIAAWSAIVAPDR
ncbi:phosphopantetheine-binding protein [Actinokineospora inagensis]|uniref:phosphopantetheine-binding protein n=1 Tax=Actinokineospora inagensis TaxID=103730 RepID=UPI000417B87C|nr:phosphopantetheine-binding protein [Actinokineospora inagensis]